MARFYPLYVRRSDGKSEIVSKKKTEPNGPTDDQLDRKPDKNGISDFYREVAEEEIKHLDWRRKLGGMLVREIGSKEQQDKGYILAALPEGYRLFEHVKSKVADADEKVDESKTQKVKSHAGGGHDRQDAYLYGHPLGRKKRFRSPADFFPHLLWLTTDESGDPDNCSCKICAPDELQMDVKPAKTKDIKQEDVKPEPATAVKHPVVEIPIRRTPSQDGQKPNAKPSRSPIPEAASQIPQPSPLPQARSVDQQLDFQYNRFMFRAGEVAWFNRGQAWGLGFITRRYAFQSSSDSQPTRAYIVQPLSYPSNHPQTVNLQGDHLLRPWLAWSVPPYTNAKLNEIDVSFETADWNGIVQRRYGQGDPEVDGSIMAAKAVDESYTLFQPLKKVVPQPGSEETYWAGMYLGAEKIWTGDPVRLNTSAGIEIMIISAIIDKARPSYGGNPLPKAVYIVGDIYTLTTTSSSSAETPNTPHFPNRLTTDFKFRNSFMQPAKGQISYFQLTKAQTRLDLLSIKGRWYEATLLLPMIQGQQVFLEQARRGEINDASLLMNGRGDCNTRGQGMKTGAGIRKSTRMEALGRAVPSGTQIVDGITPPSEIFSGEEPMDLDVGSGAGNGGQEQSGDAVQHGHGGLDEFMDLDSMEHDSMPGFGQEYGSQNAGQGFY
ncbi:MAG: hypothetical protein M1820_001263 [Bogoriella megaspora]|nr:MAG: hypothetical protein M1820_001263 [Bogoriella megaspora]